jgi:hypothetical protein
MTRLGAAKEAWQAFIDSGLGPDLLPVVCDLNLPISPRSKLSAVDGKTPSAINENGEVYGIAGWTDRNSSQQDIATWSRDPRLGIGVVCRQVKAFDIDIDDPAEAEAATELLQSEIEARTGRRAAVRSRPNSARKLLVVRCQESMGKAVIPTSNGEIEFLGDRQYFVAAGTHKSGAKQKLTGFRDLPELSAGQLGEILETFEMLFGAGPSRGSGAATKSGGRADPANLIPTAHMSEIEEVLTRIPNADLSYDDWISVGMAVHHTSGGTEEGYDAWLRWSETSGKHDASNMLGRWGSFGKNAGKPRTLASLIAMAKAANAPGVSLKALPAPSAASLGRKLLQPLSEALEDNEPPRWLIKDLIEEETFGMLHGPSGAGKSFIVIDLAMHLATGKSEWHGMAIPRGGPVVYLAGEGHAGLRRRLRTWNQHHGGSATAPFTLGTYAFDLNSPAGEVAAVGAIEALLEVPKLVIVDTLHRFMAGDENSAGDAKTLIDACGRLQSKFGCAVLLVHHTGNNAEAQHRARGSSAWRAALDFELNVKQGSGRISLSCQKLKDGAAPADRYFKLIDVEIDGMIDPDGKPVCSAVIESVATPMRRSSADTKLDNAKSDLRRAFTVGGEAMPDGTAYIGRKALLDYLITHKGLTEGSAKAELKPSRGGLVATLTYHQVVRQEGDGWAIADPSIASRTDSNFTRTDADMSADISVKRPFGQNADERTDTDTPL